MVEEISDTIKQKLKDICKDPDGKSEEYRMIIEVLETTSGYSKATTAPAIKREFQQLVDSYFSYKEDKNE